MAQDSVTVKMTGTEDAIKNIEKYFKQNVKVLSK